MEKGLSVMNKDIENQEEVNQPQGLAKNLVKALLTENNEQQLMIWQNKFREIVNDKNGQIKNFASNMKYILMNTDQQSGFESNDILQNLNVDKLYEEWFDQSLHLKLLQGIRSFFRQKQQLQQFFDFLKTKEHLIRQYIKLLQIKEQNQFLIRILLFYSQNYFDEVQYSSLILDDALDLREIIKHLIVNGIQNHTFLDIKLLLQIYNKYTEAVIQDLIDNEQYQYAKKVIFHQRLDMQNYPQLEEKIIEQNKENKKKIQQANEEQIEIQERKAIHHLVSSYQWYRVEENLYKRPKLLAYACDEYGIKKKNELYSINIRHQLIEQGYIKNEKTIEIINEGHNNYLPNILFDKDHFSYTSQRIKEPLPFWKIKQMKKAKKQEKQYKSSIKFSDFGISYNQVKFIDSIEGVIKVKNILLDSKLLGIDSEFNLVFNSNEKQLVSIIQFCNENNEIIILDVIKLKQEPEFIRLIQDIFQSKDILKIGHSLQYDGDTMNETIQFDSKIQLINFIDVSTIYQNIYVDDTKYSLQHIVNIVFDIGLCKAEQCSNWEMRPLRKNQIHYAAMDAFVCVELFRHFERNTENVMKYVVESSNEMKQKMLIQKLSQQQEKQDKKYQRMKEKKQKKKQNIEMVAVEYDIKIETNSKKCENSNNQIPQNNEQEVIIVSELNAQQS